MEKVAREPRMKLRVRRIEGGGKGEFSLML